MTCGSVQSWPDYQTMEDLVTQSGQLLLAKNRLRSRVVQKAVYQPPSNHHRGGYAKGTRHHT
jgi:hypothetical protein